MDNKIVKIYMKLMLILPKKQKTKNILLKLIKKYVWLLFWFEIIKPKHKKTKFLTKFSKY